MTEFKLKEHKIPLASVLWVVMLADIPAKSSTSDNQRLCLYAKTASVRRYRAYIDRRVTHADHKENDFPFWTEINCFLGWERHL